MSKDFYKKLMGEDLRFFIPLKKRFIFSFYNDAETWQECFISEHRYKIKDNYKITLMPIDQRYCSENFYISDFESLLKGGYIIEKTDINQHVEQIKWYSWLGNVPVVHTANVVV